MSCRTLLEGCSFQHGKVYQDGVSLEIASKRDGIRTGAGGAGGEAADQTATQSEQHSSLVQVSHQWEDLQAYV